MTLPAIADQFKEWLASALPNGVPIDTIEIYHPRWNRIWLARWKSNFSAVLETGAIQEFQAADFAIEQLPVEEGTGQRIRAAINGLDGGIYEQLIALSDSDVETPIQVTHRVYLSDFQSGPLVLPPPMLEVAAASCDRDVVNFDLQPSPLPNILCGRYYIYRDFPGLKEV